MEGPTRLIGETVEKNKESIVEFFRDLQNTE